MLDSSCNILSFELIQDSWIEWTMITIAKPLIGTSVVV